ncbi:MAG: flagellar hook-basal body complex protein FliE [Gammaproteobacteria bacterium]|nr:MAG: flagellar hook-basal body complex protein FliE [Gammaproteobacteria bacterium]
MSEINVNRIDVTQLLTQMRATAALAQGGANRSAESAHGVDFSGLLKTAVGQVNETQQKAASLATAFSAGTTQADLSEVMVALQKANISFQTMTQVRNKLVTAYQEIMNMQV